MTEVITIFRCNGSSSEEPEPTKLPVHFLMNGGIKSALYIPCMPNKAPGVVGFMMTHRHATPNREEVTCTVCLKDL